MKRNYLTVPAMLLGLVACSPSTVKKQTANVVTIESLDKFVELNPKQNEMRQNLLSALNEYEDADLKSGYKGYYAQLLSMAGREDIIYSDNVIKPSSNSCKPIEKTANDSNVNKVMSLVEGHSLVIINEDHKKPRDRDFIFNFVKALKDIGFTHYAAETFGDTISSYEFSTVSDGYYSNEPIYGRLVSYVKSAGFKLIKYEQKDSQRLNDTANRDERIAARENAQTDNLISAVLGANPETKMIIHVGHSHVAEIPITRRDDDIGTKWMAFRLKEKTGINPLTLSLTACSTSEKEIIIGSEILNKKGEPVPSFTDYSIAQPIISFTKNRPDWRRSIGDIDISLPTEYHNFKETVLIEARLKNHPDIAVPIDRLLLRPEENNIPLLLPSGEYRMEAFNKSGRIGGVYNIQVIPR